METDNFTQPSPWIPEQNIHYQAAFGKLIEELGELIAVVGRCQIQGVNESDPDTNEINIKVLHDEIADVNAAIYIVNDILRMNIEQINRRMMQKIRHLQGWHKLLDERYNGR